MNKRFFATLLTLCCFWVANAQINITFDVTAPTCDGFTNGRIAATVDGGTAPYAYNWSNGMNSATLFSVTAGSYMLDVTDADGNTASQSVNVEAPAPLEITTSVEGSICDGAAANYTVSASGGTAPYSYAWSNGQTGTTLDPSDEGVFYVTVTDANGCEQTFPVKVFEPFTVEVVTIATRCPNFCDASAEAVISGGRGPYTFVWNTGATEQVLETLPAGTYTVTATDANGCEVIATGIAEAASDIEYTVDVDGSCGSGDVSATLNATGGTGDLEIEWSTGDTGASVSGLTPGETYSVTVTDAVGCTKREEFTVPSDGGLVLDIEGANLACGAVTGGSATVTPMGGTAPFSIIWSDGSLDDNMISNLTAGDYSVTVIDANGCRGETMITITASQGLNLELETTPVTCGVGGDGMANVVPSGGTQPYTYAWSDGQTTGTAVDLEAGDYRVTVTDAAGCEGLANVTVEEEANIEVVTAIDEAAGSATVTPSGGTGPYTITWSNGQTGPTATGLEAGECYQVTITDANDCSVEEEICIPIIEPVNIVLLDITPACGDETGAISIDIVGGTAPYTIEWSNGVMGGTSLDELEPGNYSVIVTDAEGNQKTRFFEIEAVDLEVMTMVSPVECGTPNSGAAGVEVQNPTSEEYTYEWSNGATTSSVDNLASGTYTVTVSTAGGCSTISELIVENGDFALEVAAISDVDCDGNLGSVRMSSADEDVTYTWADGAMGAERTDLAAGTYTVTATDAAGCEATQEITIGDADAVEAAFTVEQTGMDCETGLVTLQVSDASTGNVTDWEWRYGDEVTTGQDNITIEIDPSELDMLNIQLGASSADGCTSVMGETISVMEFVLDVAAPTSVSVCEGEEIMLGVENNNPDMNLTYEWSPADQFEEGTANSATPNFIGMGTTEVTVLVTNEMGCTFEQTIPITIAENVMPDLSALTYEESCLGLVVDFAGMPDLEGYTWDFGDPNNPTTSDDMNPSFEYSEPGEYVLTLTPGENAMCQEAASTTIVVDGERELEFDIEGDTQFCSDGNALMVDDSNFSEVRWYTADDTETPVGTGSEFTPEPGDYIVEVENEEGCTGRQELTIDDRRINVALEEGYQVCEGDDIQVSLENLNEEDDLIIEWSPNDPLLIDDINSDSPIFTLDETTTFTVTTTNQFGCSMTQEVTIEVSGLPDASVVAERDTIFLGQDTGLDVVGADDGYTYTWDNGSSLTRDDIANPTADPEETTTYNLLIENEDGCFVEQTIQIVVLTDECDDTHIFVPNAFTPNDDGANDLLFVRGAHIDEMSFVIHNRWGEMVFQTTDQGIGWDGYFQGQNEIAAGDVFGYYLEVTCFDGTSTVIKGNVTILR